MDSVHQLVAVVVATNPMQASFLDAALACLSPDERATLHSYVDYWLATGLPLEALAESYNLIVSDTLQQQIYFRRHHRYRYSTFKEVADSVYFNPEYMSKYMRGLGLTTLLWPNHLELTRFFNRTLPAATSGAYLEVGPGHGFYFIEALRRATFSRYVGVDISPTSLAMTRGAIASGFFGDFSGYELIEADFLHWRADAAFSAVVMGEVLEHVEDPAAFLAHIREVSKPNSFIFITTCLNCPAIDHITLFRCMEELERLARSADLTIADELVVPYHGLTLEESMDERLPVNVGLVLAHV